MGKKVKDFFNEKIARESELSIDDIRCLNVTSSYARGYDEYLNRTSDSWKALIPHCNFNSFSDSNESDKDCYLRLKSRFNIPLEVFEQWLYFHYYEPNTIDNYAWIDYDRIKFTLVDFDCETIKDFRVINNFKQDFEGCCLHKSYDTIPFIDIDMQYWLEHGTWRTPPIVLDVNSLTKKHIPSHADIDSNYQLVEGHSRLGYLLSIMNCKLKYEKKHKVYLMKYLS